jgi:hypothetical protein
MQPAAVANAVTTRRNLLLVATAALVLPGAAACGGAAGGAGAPAAAPRPGPRDARRSRSP